MATITVTFNGTQTDLDDFCAVHNYQSTIDGVANPESKTQFFQRTVREGVWNDVKIRRAQVASDTARATELAKVVNF